jgi:hypothetical protein
MTVEAGDVVASHLRRTHLLERLIGEDGAASLYGLPEPRPLVAKIYHEGIDMALRERRVQAMLDRPPDLPDVLDDGERHVRIAWPDAMLRDEEDRFVGYLMPAIDMLATSELEWLLQERQARAAGLLLPLGARLQLAANLATAIAALHERGHRVVGLSPAMLRFHAPSLNIAIPDVDGFSIQGDNERFPAEGVVADYLAPEFQDKPIPAQGEEAQDLFALAVVIFQMLNFGIHPFSGRSKHDDVPADIPGRIARRCYPYGATANPDVEPDRFSGHWAMPEDLQILFDQSFAGDGVARPSAGQWSTLLQIYAMPSNQCLHLCEKNAAHQYFVGLPCAACARTELLIQSANASGMALDADEEEDTALQAFGTPETVAPPPSMEWQVTQPLPESHEPEEQKRGLSKGAVTALQIAAIVLVVGVGMKLGLSQRGNTAQPAPARAAIPEPTTAPGVPRPDPDLAGFPLMEKEEALTEGHVLAAANALVTGHRDVWDQTIATLRSGAAAHSAPRQKGKQEAFAKFSASVTPEHYDERQRQYLLRDVRQIVREDPYDDEAAFELGWLSLLGGEREAAKSFFLHAIWANPDRADAWFGFGVTCFDRDQTTGSLAAAELLSPDPAQARHMREGFPPVLLELNSIKAQKFSLLQARALRIAEQNRPASASPGADASASPAASGPAASK